MKKILVASDSFKGTLSSIEIGEKFQEKISNAQVDIISVSDGGEGFTESIKFNSDKFTSMFVEVQDAMSETKTVEVIIVGKTAFFDVASVVALHDYPNVSALEKTSCGIGYVIQKLEEVDWIDSIGIGLGGSSTSLIGWGMLQHLGTTFFDKDGERILEWRKFGDIVSYELPTLSKKIIAYSDVKTKLIEDEGFLMYATQKFCSDGDKVLLGKFAAKLASLDKEEVYKQESTGAAGGLGYAIKKFLGGEIKNGMDKMLELANFAERSKEYDFVVTGEGKFDKQTAEGKVPIAIRNNSHAKQNVLIAGFIEEKSVAEKEFDYSYQLMKESQSLDEAISNTKQNLDDSIEKFIKDVL